MVIADGWQIGRRRFLAAGTLAERIGWRRLLQRAIQHLPGSHPTATNTLAFSRAPSDGGALGLQAFSGFEAFFRRNEREIFGYLWRMTGDEQAAYDLCQETFLRAWQHFDRISAYERPGGWLFRVATNLALTYQRRASAPIGAAHSFATGGDPHRQRPIVAAGDE